ncbi:MAG: Rpn family recombination-promoting nuclease/putative transposase [Eubacterium sp.]|nr:Rpn family recombination-promoting nuclease/putative transposase [Eubacterium sp.]
MVRDIEWKGYFADDERYADIINGIACQGRQVVAKTDLYELDTQSGFLSGVKFVRERRSKVKHGRVRIRDCIRKTAFGVNFAIIGIESQEVTDYSMPLRNMAYDVGEYEKQASKIRKSVRKNHQTLRTGEYLYGFCKESRLYPVVTFILYFGEKKWDGPRTLHEILDFTDIPPGLKKMIPDYKINVIEIKSLEDTSVFKTDVKQVFDFIRCAEDKKALQELVEKDDYYKNMEEDAFDVVSRYTNTAGLVEVKEYYRKEGGINMCKAITDWLEESKEEGREAGIEEGRQQEAERFSRLILLLSEQDRMDDLVRAAKDEKYRKRLLRKELGIK